jgi:hypothetical protein
MVVITGVRFAGKVDAVPRVGHVATRFFHLYYVPLIPLGTFLVINEQDENAAGIPLPFSGKSILIGWLRTAAWLGLIGMGVLAIMAAADNKPHVAGVVLVGAALAGAVLAVLYRLRSITHASYERAADIARRAGLSPEQRLMVEITFGRMTADQAESELRKLYETMRPPSPQQSPQPSTI